MPKKDLEDNEANDFKDSKKETKNLYDKLDATQNELNAYKTHNLKLKKEKLDLEYKVKDLQTQLADNTKRFSRYSLLRMELITNSFMRLVVVATFAIVGPILLLSYLFQLNVDSVLLDVFKIWLGAAIGISTNLLQKTDKDKGSQE